LLKEDKKNKPVLEITGLQHRMFVYLVNFTPSAPPFLQEIKVKFGLLSQYYIINFAIGQEK
jgi:hypothetical protein